MKRILAVTVLALTAGAGPALRAQPARSAEAQLRAAQHTEEVEGNLKEAIELYKAVARSGNRTLEATALLRMAECHRKLGDAQAREIYEQIIRRYADQPDAVATAQARLTAAGPATSIKGDRAVWIGPKVDLFGQASPDGRLITYVDWEVGDLAVHDVAANTDRALTTDGRATRYAQFAEASAVSRDGAFVAYSWFSDKQVRELRVLSLHVNGAEKPRTFFAGSADISFISPRDWSPDGRWVAASIQRKDGTGQLAVINVADGSLRILKSAGWSGPNRMFFSADGRYIAYDLPAADASEQRDLFIIAVDATREIRAVDHTADERVMGWSPDGTRLLFSSDQTGAAGLWSISVADGRPQGAPELLRADTGGGESLGITASGTLYLYKLITSRDVRVAPIDVTAGKLGNPTSFVRGFVPDGRDPHWSPDGKYLAYQACGGPCIAVRTVESGDVRKVLPRGLLYPRDPQWSPDGRFFIVAGRDRNGRNGIFKVDSQSGDTTSLVMGPGLGSSPQWSRDGRKIYYTGSGIVERDLESGIDRTVTDRPVMRNISVSPDGRFIAARTATDEGTKTFALLLIPTAGEPTRELLHVPQSEDWGSTHTAEWTADGQALLVVRPKGRRHELVLVPIDGSPPRTLAIDPAAWIEGAVGGVDRGFSLSPDGRQVAFLTGKTAAEVWAVENIVPGRRSRR